MSRIVLVHGRAQEHKDAKELKAEWLKAFQVGLDSANLAMPLTPEHIRLPYYGQTLYDLAASSSSVADVVVMGTSSADELAFQAEIFREVQQQLGISDQEIRADVGLGEVPMGGLASKEWVQGILRAIDRHVPGGSAATMATVTRDAYQYLTIPGIRDEIETGVLAAFESDIRTVVVGHSLGSIVAYNLLKREGKSRNWRVPLFVTLGSPLGVSVIRRKLAPLKHPSCVGTWLNAYDERDVVALYGLTKSHFPIDPEPENRSDMRNETSNHHGIIGYLSDSVVAKRICEALR